MMTGLLLSPAVEASVLCFPARSAKKTPDARATAREVAQTLFDLETPFAMTAGRAVPDCVTLSSPSARCPVTCYLPKRLSGASVHGLLLCETGIEALHKICRATTF